MSYAAASRLGLLIAMSLWAAISAVAVAKSVREEDKASAWTWAAVFLVSTLLAAWSFERLL